MESNKNNDDQLLWVFLVCQICKKILKEPKTLSCQHSFCYLCLAKDFEEHGD